ncbi:MAG: GNAT family N-acetyltransferase, partial [Spirochaetaceae bacterium]|nr:GNAT family N-acetyltransferase [Spirochaetaceae bacterium]
LFNYPLSVGEFYSIPFFYFEPKLCFVALDYNQRPAGYIVGTSNTLLYNSWLNSNWLPPLQPLYKGACAKSEDEQTVISEIIKGQGQGLWEHSGYSAQLRIDLLESIRGEGLGRGLVEEFITKLYEANVPGVHLRISLKNKDTIGFYEKMGFNILETTEHGYYMGMKLK